MKRLYIYVLSTLALLPSAAFAQDKGDGGSMFGVMGDYMRDGGSVMWVILLVSIIGVAVFIERAFDLYILRRLSVGGFMSSVLASVESRQYRQAIDRCNVRSRHPLVSVCKAGLLRANRREKEIERAMEKEMLAALPHLQKRTAMLSLLANSATLLGLLGTIFGLITAFNAVAAASAAERQTALAAGISEAMYTTAFGIAVAVPLLFFHYFLSKRQERIILEVEGGASAILVSLAGGTQEQQVRSSAPSRHSEPAAAAVSYSARP